MKTFCGTDIIEVNRIQEIIEEEKEKFLERIFTQKEIAYCEKKKIVKYQHYAGRFAAKEAIFKAISPFLKNKYDISWKNIEIINDENGRPIANLIGICLKNIGNMDISISHVKDMAIATCIISCK